MIENLDYVFPRVLSLYGHGRPDQAAVTLRNIWKLVDERRDIYGRFVVDIAGLTTTCPDTSKDQVDAMWEDVYGRMVLPLDRTLVRLGVHPGSFEVH